MKPPPVSFHQLKNRNSNPGVFFLEVDLGSTTFLFKESKLVQQWNQFLSFLNMFNLQFLGNASRKWIVTWWMFQLAMLGPRGSFQPWATLQYAMKSCLVDGIFVVDHC